MILKRLRDYWRSYQALKRRNERERDECMMPEPVLFGSREPQRAADVEYGDTSEMIRITRDRNDIDGAREVADAIVNAGINARVDPDGSIYVPTGSYDGSPWDDDDMRMIVEYHDDDSDTDAPSSTPLRWVAMTTAGARPKATGTALVLFAHQVPDPDRPISWVSLFPENATHYMVIPPPDDEKYDVNQSEGATVRGKFGPILAPGTPDLLTGNPTATADLRMSDIMGARRDIAGPSGAK